MLRSTLFALSVLVAPVANAADVPPAMSQYIYDDLMTWINDTRIVAAVTAQNSQTSRLSQDDIIARDNAWRAEVGQSSTPMIDGVLNAPLSAFLREHLEKSGGRITEVFVMDGKGLNVAASGVTSDYWQGDEAKFQETYSKGAGSVFIDEVELDESTQTYQGQVSYAVTDPVSGAVVGAITVGLDAGAFF
ncbi:hypothetical protein GV827_13595 [Sulfitobacter sp. JBTF-M27]|uniref:Penicillin-binding protein activator LpoB n=1 Tax=Sulfitobacter sediminilitoris TaxID=2698830 RepID=A0A6P0CE36_9RHOB|nr:hypothetical protein [Sulfitobacter sediminilitoris]NEK23436.1 hypothetical protein [Sulfitobacter sediminilitoris]